MALRGCASTDWLLLKGPWELMNWSLPWLGGGDWPALPRYCWIATGSTAGLDLCDAPLLRGPEEEERPGHIYRKMEASGRAGEGACSRRTRAAEKPLALQNVHADREVISAGTALCGL